MQTIFTDTLQQAFEQVGYEFPHINGAAITRFSTNGKGGDKAGWLKVFADGDGAAFGCWRSNEQYTWQRKRDQATPISQAELDALRAKHKAAQQEAEQARDAAYADKAIEAREKIEQAQPATNHPYLIKKGIEASGALLCGDNLLIPVYGPTGIQSYQTIDADGNKMFMKGGKVSGGFFVIGEKTERTILCEGFATGATVHAATGDRVVVAFNSGNLLHVAKALRAKYPTARILIAGDDDHASKENGGRKAAEAAAKAINAAAVYPTFTQGQEGSDFNDMAQLNGMDGVAKAFAPQTIRASSGYVCADDLSKRQRMGWRIKDMVPRKGLCVVWGPPGSGKSFFVLDMACAIARGMDKYHGKRIRPGVVIYMAMEGNLQDRVDAYKKRHHLTEGDLANLYIKHGTVNFMDEQVVMAECAAIKDAIGDVEVAMVVVDTIARSMPGGNENGSESMGAAINGYKIVEDYFNTCVMPLHHCGKDVERGMRGHSSLLGAIDAEIEIKRNADDPVRVLHVGKQKDGLDHYDLFNFKLEQIVLGPTSRWDEDAAPDEMDASCVLQITEEAAAVKKPSGERTTRNGNMIDKAVEGARAINGDIRKEEVRVQFYLLHEGNPDAKNVAFRREW